MTTLNFDSSNRIFICGMTQSGKSTLGAYLFSLCPKGILYDSDLESDKFERLLRTSLGVRVHTIPDLLKALTKHAKIVFQPYGYSTEVFEEFCRIVYHLSNLTVFITEISSYAPLHKISPWFNMLVRRGEKRGIGLIYDTQRTADVHKTPISQSKHIIIFRQFLPNDVNYLYQFVGEAAYVSRDLLPYHFLHYFCGKVTQNVPIKV